MKRFLSGALSKRPFAAKIRLNHRGNISFFFFFPQYTIYLRTHRRAVKERRIEKRGKEREETIGIKELEVGSQPPEPLTRTHAQMQMYRRAIISATVFIYEDAKWPSTTRVS